MLRSTGDCEAAVGSQSGDSEPAAASPATSFGIATRTPEGKALIDSLGEFPSDASRALDADGPRFVS
jgi:hypothetical protein